MTVSERLRTASLHAPPNKSIEARGLASANVPRWGRCLRRKNVAVLLTGCLGGPRSDCAAWSLTCGAISAGVPVRMPKSGCIAVNWCHQSPHGSRSLGRLDGRHRARFPRHLQKAVVGCLPTGVGGCDVG